MDPKVTLEILEPCLVNGEPCEVGAPVTVLPHQAAQMVALGRARYPDVSTPPGVVETRDPTHRKRSK